MDIFELEKDNIVSIIIDNCLPSRSLYNLYNTSKKINEILNYIKQNWFNIVNIKNKNIYYRIYNAPYDSIIVKYDYICNLINNISIHKKYIIIHYLTLKYKSNEIFSQYLLELYKMILTTNKLTKHTKTYVEIEIEHKKFNKTTYNIISKDN